LGREGLERVDVRLRTVGHGRHCHDTYAIGLTLQGVQAFDYRGVARRTLAGEAYVLHPDERHDGRPGADGGFAYRTLYIPPALISACLGVGVLPFVAQPVRDRGRLRQVILEILAATDDDPDDLRLGDMMVTLADHLARAAGPGPRFASRSVLRLDRRAVMRASEALRGAVRTGLSAADLERVSGLDRWSLYRQFRAVHGVSPGRYLIARRLDAARVAITAGVPLAEAALNAGFADQSHMTRQFRASVGLTPGYWRRLTQERALP